jgi:tetratricopeptide (TPR) repeat protein
LTGFVAVFGAKNGETLALRRNYASALGSAGKCETARREIEGVIEATPDDGSNQPALARLTRAKIERWCGNFELAADQLADTRRILEGLKLQRATDQANVAMELGLSYLEAGRLREARRELDTALSLSEPLRTQMTPVRASVMLANARIDLAEGNAERALQGFVEVDQFWRKFDDSNRFAGEAAYWLGRGLDRAGRNADAGVAFARARTILSRSPFQSDRRLVETIQTR